ncbi:hypothetical protein [Streptomyces sp. NPDC049585]|uniref:LppU/SCO3897 family protein n=1 Tax=Streptomyces sp. NPDC049585 TaxID=3155154 RepID=UPI00341B6813
MTTPPPNQHPYAPQGGGTPYGQQPPAPYGQQPGPYPQQPGPYPQQPGPYGQQPPAPYGQPGTFPGNPVQPPKRSKLKFIRKVVVPIIAIIVAACGWFFSKGDDTQKLAVGDCLRNSGTENKPEIHKVDCTDAKATHKVLKKVSGTYSDSVCNGVEGTVAALTWEERRNNFVLCLADNKK